MRRQMLWGPLHQMGMMRQVDLVPIAIVIVQIAIVNIRIAIAIIRIAIAITPIAIAIIHIYICYSLGMVLLDGH